MKHVVAKFIPCLLLPEQKEHCAEVANDLIQIATNEPDFLKKAITGDESWVYGYDPEKKKRCGHPSGSHLILQTRRRHSKVAARSRPCSLCFFDWEGVVHHEYVPSQGQIINKEHYLNVLH
ncbi:hypothetical protein HJG60_010924 [Phyllostomus discolor]|uniref:Mariner Mos1 transposase n=1 Tax=Phyllostomus discolor TaxID=89673 RepID=A0A834A7V7_9CHIR|nr:hypothetical protein HJG60_010924 [Phyllostomus discolor]